LSVVDEAFIDGWVQRLRREVPDAVAIFVGGSYLRGEAGPFSDIDFDVVVGDGPREGWPAWFDTSGDVLVRVSTWIRDADAWFAARDEPQEWAYGLPSADPERLCWVADEVWRQRLEAAPARFPPGEPEIDHFVGEVGKIGNAWYAGDELMLRLAGQDLARSVASLLLPLNPMAPVSSRGAALRTVLGYPVAPAGYREDMLACMGLRGPATAADVHAAACRLAAGVLDLLEQHQQRYAEVLPADATDALRDGTMRRYLEQAIAGPA